MYYSSLQPTSKFPRVTIRVHVGFMFDPIYSWVVLASEPLVLNVPLVHVKIGVSLGVFETIPNFDPKNHCLFQNFDAC
jgi:hypothetical protein